MIHVCLCMNDKTGRYSKFVGTTIHSIFENTLSYVTVHILHDNTLTADNRDKFVYLAGQYGQTIKFYNVEELCPDEVKFITETFPKAEKTRYTVGMFYRFFIPELLPAEIKKAIYLDADIIVNLDLSELWKIDLGNKSLATVADIDCNHRTHARDANSKFLITNGFVAAEDYFVSGVLMMNLSRFREEKGILKDGIELLNTYPKLKYPDQDILNYFFSKDYVKLDEKFDVFVTHERSTVGKNGSTRSAIYHYVIGCLNLNMADSFSRLWMNHFIKTPFFSVDSIGHIFQEMERLHDDLKGFAVNATKIVSGKNRAFFIEPQKIGWLKKLFAADDDEIFLPAENKEENIVNLIDEMRHTKGKTVFFIMTAKHMNKPFPFDRLIQEGFVEGVDFVKAWSFLSGRKGVHYNSSPFMKSL